MSALSLARPFVALLLLVAAIAPLAASQTTFSEDFEGGSNIGGWRWGTGNESFSPLNGNPGAFLRDLTLFTAQPILRTAQPSGPTPFIGDYRSMNVTSVGIDLITLDKDFPVESNRWLTLMLIDDNGTPDLFGDDVGAYFVGDMLVPSAGVPIDAPAGWTSYDFEIDSQAAAMPPGWEGFTNGPPVPSWPDLMSDVDAVQFWYGVPGTIFLFDSWDVGTDNPRITTGTCQADLGSAGPGAMALSICGGVLASGQTAQLQLDGALPSTIVYYVIGLQANPTPFEGGVLVPVPILTVKAFFSDPAGSFSLTIPGGAGPIDAVLQAVSPDGSLPGGYALSNALQVEFLP